MLLVPRVRLSRLRVLGVPLAAALVLAAQPGESYEVRLDTTAEAPVGALIRTGSLVLTGGAEGAQTPQQIVSAARADYANILAILYGEGYYGGRISILIDGHEAASLPAFEPPAQVRDVVVKVDPGRQFTFGKAATGPLAPKTTLPEGFRTGGPARAELVREAAAAAVAGWRALGHAKAAVGARRIVARHGPAELDAEVTIVPGPELSFGDVVVSGNERVRPDRIREIAGLRRGRTYDPAMIETAARRLRDTGAFRSVSLEDAAAANPDGTLDVLTTVLEQPPRRFGFGAEVSSQVGATVSAYWMHRNLLGGAERLRFDAEASGIGGHTGSFLVGGSGVDYRLSATFTRPATFSAANTLTARAEVARLDEPDFFSRQGLVELGLTREIDARTRVTAALQYRFSRVADALGKRNFNLLMLPLTGERDARDAPLDPHAGYFLRLEVNPYAGLAGSRSGARIYADARAYYAPGASDRVTLAGRVQFGSVLGSGITETPPDLVFFSGGGGTVRGQPYKSLKVDLGGGVSSGGRGFLGVSGEARVRVAKNISVVGFYDFGVIGPDPMPGRGESHAGAGAGVRYDTSFGPIRLDMAGPVSGSTGKGIQLYVGVGQAF